MKRKSIISLLCLMMATCFFAGCDMLGLGKEPHVHTFDTVWTHDATSHWYEATCDCEDVEVVKANHVDENNDSLCDVCKYDYDHAHTFQTEDDWTVDCTNHWRAATCGHLVAAQDVEAHADTNGDGKCDTCNYVIEDIHKHVYADGWTTDDEYHWHAAICEHKAEKSGEEEHKLNAAGDCLVCGEHLVDVDPTSVEEVLLAAQANDYKISFGDVIATQAVYGGTGAQILENGKTNRVHFALGNGESYIQYISFDKNSNYLGQEEQWFERISEDEVFGAAMLDGEYVLSPIAGDAKFLNGYNYIPGSILPSDADDTSTLANLFNLLYKQMKVGERVSNAKEGYNAETDRYEFSYTYYSVNTTTVGGVFYSIELALYNVAVEFTVNEDMIIDWAEFEVEVYRDYGDEATGDRDLAYTYEIGEDGATVTLTSDPTLKATANPSYYRYSVAQTAGDRSFTTPYPRESLLPTNFELYYVTKYHDDDYKFNVLSEEKVEETITVQETEYVSYFDEYGEPCDERVVQRSKYVRLRLGDALPITANFGFLNMDDLDVSFVNKTEGSSGSLWTMDPFYNAMTNCIAFYPKDAGTYELTIRLDKIEKTFTVIVPGETSGGGEGEGEGGETDDPNADYEAVITETSGSVWFSAAEITAGEASRKLTIAEDGKYKISSNDLFVSGVQDASDNAVAADKGVYTLTAGDYTVSFGMFGNLGVKADKQYNVQVVKEEGSDTPPAGDTTDISGTYLTSNGSLVIDNATSTIVYAFNTYEFTYTYAISNNVVTLYKDGNAIAPGMASYSGKLELDANGMPETWYYNGNTYALTKVTEGGEGGGDEGKDPTAVTDVEIIAGVNSLTIAENTYIEVSAQGFVGSYTVTWDVANVTVEINGNAIANGDIFTSASPMLSNTFKIYGANYAAVEALTLTFAEYVAPAIELTVDENIVAVSSQGADVTFTATEAGTYTFTVGANTVLGYGYENKFAGESYELTLTAGEKVEFFVGTEDYTEGNVVITVTYTTGGDVGGGDEPTTLEPVGYLYEGMVNDITVTEEDLANGYVAYSFFAMMGGNYAFVSGDVSVSAIYDSEGKELTAVEFGVYAMEESASYIVKINTGLVFNAGTYQINVAYQYPLGSQENPIELWAAGDNVANWEGGYTPVWYTYNVWEDGVLTVSTTNETALLILRLVEDTESVDGTVSLKAIAGASYFIGVLGGADAQEIPFTVAFEAGEYEGDGTVNMPVAMKVGDNKATVEAYESTYLMYKATAAGILTLTAGENCAYYIRYPEYMEPVEGVVTLNMNADEFIFVCVNTADWSAGTVVLTATWNEITANTTATIVEGENELTIDEYTYI